MSPRYQSLALADMPAFGLLLRSISLVAGSLVL